MSTTQSIYEWALDLGLKMEEAEIVAGISLDKIAPAKITEGGYKITFRGSPPEGKSLLLCIGSDKATLDVTRGYSKSRLPELLSAIDAAKAWGKKVRCYLTLGANGRPVGDWNSNEVDMVCPVAPHTGPISLEGLGKSEYTYAGKGTGRILTAAINGRYYFKYDGWFETKSAKRGFDCTTYVGCAFGRQTGMGARGDKLAEALRAKKLKHDKDGSSHSLENANIEVVKDFFKHGKGKSGQYIMWTSTHVVAVKNGTVYEYIQTGFRKKSVQSWNFRPVPHSVRKL